MTETMVCEIIGFKVVFLMKYMLLPDSFKGTMSSQQVCRVMGRAIRLADPSAQVDAIPLADGGEGTVEAMIDACGGEIIRAKAVGPDGVEREAFYGVLPDGRAVIEMAAAAGLPLALGKTGVMEATTYGVGQLILSAIDRGCKNILLGLGGSATNDGGCGCAAALGVKFKNNRGEDFIPAGGTLLDIGSIDISEARERLAGAKIDVMCDIDNPLTGQMGAAAVFAPQKGADRRQIELLDWGLAHMARLIERDIGIDVVDMPGSGAAGGMGAGAVAFLGGELKRGIDLVLDACQFERRASDADIVITGEGRVDAQSAMGKALSGVSSRARKLGLPVLVIAGDVGEGAKELYKLGVTAIFSTNLRAVPFSQARLTAERDLEFVTESAVRLIASCESGTKTK